MVQPVGIAHRPPEEEDIAAAVRKLRVGRPEVPSGMKAEQLNTWLREASREKDPDTKKRDKLMSINKVVFQDGCILEANYMDHDGTNTEG